MQSGFLNHSCENYVTEKDLLFVEVMSFVESLQQLDTGCLV